MVDRTLIDEALRKLENDEQLGEKLNTLISMQLKQDRDKARKELEANLEALQIEGGALENGGVWRVDWSKSE